MLQINRDKLRCPRCGSRLVACLAINGGFSKHWMRCSKNLCQTYIDTTLPLPSQKSVLEDRSRYIMQAGGYGSGKTFTGIKAKIKHGLITPRGASLLGAPTFPQLNSTLKKDLEEELPIDFVKSYSKQANEFTLKNNHTYLYRSFDDPHKLRSLNLSSFTILEASGASFSTFTQLQSRLRNTAATIFERDSDGNVIYELSPTGDYIPKIKADWRQGHLETNPSPNWVRTEFLFRSGRVMFHGESNEEPYMYSEVNPNYSTHIIPTSANILLPPNFEEEQTHGKPAWYIKRYFKGSFLYSEGMVYPRVQESIVKPFQIPKHWKRIVAMDFGINDNTHFVFLAVDPVNKVAYVYDELVINNADVRHITLEYRKKLQEIPSGGLMKTPVMDGRSINVRQAHDVNVTLGDLFLEEGVIFDPAQMNMDARVIRTNTLINLGQLKIFDTCVGLIKEITEHKFPEKDIDKPHKNTDKPEDVRNHGVNALEFAVMELPPNLAEYNFTLYNVDGTVIRAETNKEKNENQWEFNPLGGTTDEFNSYYSDGFDMYDGYNLNTLGNNSDD